MFEAEALEFPWMAELPRAEKSKARAATELVNEFIALQKKHGALLPAPMVAVALNVSRARIYQFIDEGRLKSVMFRGMHYISEGDLKDFAKQERKNGRPVTARQVTLAECFEIGKEVEKTLRKK